MGMPVSALERAKAWSRFAGGGCVGEEDEEPMQAATPVTRVTPVRAVADLDLDAKRKNHPKRKPQRRGGKQKEKPLKER